MRTELGKVAVARAQWLKRLARSRSDRVGFVFSGGGPLGALQVGALKALFERDISPQLAVGTSVGSLNATLLAFDPTPTGVERLEGVWLRLRDEDLFPGARFRASWARMLVKGNRIFDNFGLERVIRTRLGDATFEDAVIPLAVVATELDTGLEKVFTSGPLVEPLLASSAMPGVYPPVEVDGKNYIDGGVVNNVPIRPALHMGGRTLYVLNTTATSHQKRPLVRPMDYLLHAFAIARSQRWVVEQAMLANERVRVIMLPAIQLDFFVPFASLEHTERLIQLSYERTREFLSGLERAPEGYERIVERVPGGGSVEAIAEAK
ncbi:MAG: patatin-like phospholipase family protein [Actinomycetota bacterium]